MRDKYKYCAHKDDLLLCVGSAMFEVGEGKFTGKQAYPPVISTLGDIDDYTKLLITNSFAAWGDSELDGLKDEIDDETNIRFPGVVDHYRERRNAVPLFKFMGFSCGLGYVHPSNGDTVVSALIGGLTTVRNGAFPIKTGDLVMWYFDFEAICFDKNGRRVVVQQQNGNMLPEPGIGLDPRDAGVAMRDDDGIIDRRNAWQRQNGNVGAPGHNIDTNQERHGGKHNVFLVKPFFHTSARDYYMDRVRIIGKALANARPYDMVDIQIGSQCI